MFQVGQKVSPIPEKGGPTTRFGFVTIARIRHDPIDPDNTMLFFSEANIGCELSGWGWYLAFPDESCGDDIDGWGWYAYRFAPTDVLSEPDFSLEDIGRAEDIIHGKGSVNHCGNGVGVPVMEHPGRDRGT